MFNPFRKKDQPQTSKEDSSLEGLVSPDSGEMIKFKSDAEERREYRLRLVEGMKTSETGLLSDSFNVWAGNIGLLKDGLQYLNKVKPVFHYIESYRRPHAYRDNDYANTLKILSHPDAIKEFDRLADKFNELLPICQQKQIIQPLLDIANQAKLLIYGPNYVDPETFERKDFPFANDDQKLIQKKLKRDSLRVKEEMERANYTLNPDYFNAWGCLHLTDDDVADDIFQKISPIPHYQKYFARNGLSSVAEKIIQLSNPDMVKEIDALVDEFNSQLENCKKNNDRKTLRTIAIKAINLIYQNFPDQLAKITQE